MDRDIFLSEEEKEKALAHYELILQLKGHAGFQVLIEYLKADAHEAMHELKNVDSEDPKRIRSLQNQIWRYEGLIDKIEYLISLGEAVRIDKIENDEGE